MAGRPRGGALHHPEAEEMDLLAVLHALSDVTRMTIVQTLLATDERACGTFPVQVAASTLSHHFKVLREAGIIRQREEGTRRCTSLREEELEARSPGVIPAITSAYAPQATAA